MKNKNNRSKIKLFKIEGLFGIQDVTIPFDKGIKIIVAENGTGKTTILNALYYTLTCKFPELNSIDFKVISLEFFSGKKAVIRKEDLNYADFSNNSNRDDSKYFNVLKNNFTLSEIQYFVRDLKTSSNRDNKDSYQRVKRELTNAILQKKLNYSPNQIMLAFTRLMELDNDVVYRSKTIEFSKIIDEELEGEILYFPTYRRIEEDLQKLGLKDIDISEEDNKLIQFGMTDVEKRFEAITDAIKNSALEWFSKVTGAMLKQLVDGIKVTSEMKQSIQQPEALRIVLDRVGENLTKDYKQNIYNLIKSKEIDDEKYYPLVYFLSNLIKIYDQQREKDNAIKKFSKVCDKYLANKQIEYNESAVKIDIVQKKTLKPIKPSTLSSGEKQIISIFSKLFLDLDENFILLFDEPELSLSIDWQRLLLPDIIESGKCNLLLATTHSPFIFDNELDSFATGLDLFVKEYENESC